MLPLPIMNVYGNIQPHYFKGNLQQISAGAGYTPQGRNNTSNANVNLPEYPRVYFYGGLNAGNGYTTDVFYYDMVLNRYVLVAASSLGAYRGATMVYANDGYVYGFGGANTSNVGQTQFFRINVSTNALELVTGDTNRQPAGFTQTALAYENMIFYFGGASSAARQIIYRYNTTTKAWTTVRTGVTNPDIIGSPTSSIVYNNKIYIACATGFYEFNPTTFVLTALPNQPASYSTGGYSFIVNGEWYFMNNYSTNTVSKYNSDGTWTITGTTNYGTEIFSGWNGYNASLSTAFIIFGGIANEKSNRIRRLT